MLAAYGSGGIDGTIGKQYGGYLHMDIYWFGQAAFSIKAKNATIVIDPFDPKIGLPWTNQIADILLMSHDHADHHYAQGVTAGFTAEGPGEYEVKDVAIAGTRLYHDAQKGAERGPITAFTLEVEGVTICHLSDLGHELSGEQIEELSSCDVLMVPVGGTYTIDAAAAAKIVGQLEPSVVIPMHYQLPGLQVGVELADVDDFMKALGIDQWTAQASLRVTKDSLPTEMTVSVLEPKK
jgi:L-ascorbate metabolism protein UlaG (beta-lactamase superfamily)